MLSFIQNISPLELAIIILIVVILFGSKIATTLGRTTGETMKEIRKAKKSFNEAVDEIDKTIKENK